MSWALERLSHSVANAISVNEAKTNLVHEAIQIQVEDEETCRLIGTKRPAAFQKRRQDHDNLQCRLNRDKPLWNGASSVLLGTKQKDLGLHIYACETSCLSCKVHALLLGS
nr:hypothetical protein P5621_07700 [Bacillus subtilis]